MERSFGEPLYFNSQTSEEYICHFEEPKVKIFTARIESGKINRHYGESITDYVSRLMEGSAKCNFVWSNAPDLLRKARQQMPAEATRNQHGRNPATEDKNEATSQ
ncbi:TATA-box-binding protein [Trichinella pseudospiralis]